MRTLSIICLVPLLLLGACAPDQQAVAPVAANAAELPDDSLFQFTSLWQSDDDRRIKLAEYRGHPLVIGMIFTHCQYACPLIVNDMKRLDASLPEDLRREVRYLLVTFDLKRDTPQVLRDFRARSGLAGDSRWSLLRAAGEDDTLELAALLNVKYKPDASGQFSHTNLISILDPQGRLVHQQIGLNQDVSATTAMIQKHSR